MKATEAKNEVIKASALYIESEGGFSEIENKLSYTKSLDGEEMLIDVVRYKNTGESRHCFVVTESRNRLDFSYCCALFRFLWENYKINWNLFGSECSYRSGCSD